MNKPSVPRVTPIRTLGLESLTDVQAFRHALGKRASLPRIRIALRIAELPDNRIQKYERRINALLQTHGLVEFAIGAALLLLAMLAWPIRFHALSNGVNAAIWTIQTIAAAAAGGALGRYIAMRQAWNKLRAQFRKLEHEVAKRGSQIKVTAETQTLAGPDQA